MYLTIFLRWLEQQKSLHLCFLRHTLPNARFPRTTSQRKRMMSWQSLPRSHASSSTTHPSGRTCCLDPSGLPSTGGSTPCTLCSSVKSWRYSSSFDVHENTEYLADLKAWNYNNSVINFSVAPRALNSMDSRETNVDFRRQTRASSSTAPFTFSCSKLWTLLGSI